MLLMICFRGFIICFRCHFKHCCDWKSLSLYLFYLLQHLWTSRTDFCHCIDKDIMKKVNPLIFRNFFVIRISKRQWYRGNSHYQNSRNSYVCVFVLYNGETCKPKSCYQRTISLSSTSFYPRCYGENEIFSKKNKMSSKCYFDTRNLSIYILTCQIYSFIKKFHW